MIDFFRRYFRLVDKMCGDNVVTNCPTPLKRKSAKRLLNNHLADFLRGTTRNRTGDTRIFSPLLYQLSYGTICGCKDRYFFLLTKFFRSKSSIFFVGHVSTQPEVWFCRQNLIFASVWQPVKWPTTIPTLNPQTLYLYARGYIQDCGLW